MMRTLTSLRHPLCEIKRSLLTSDLLSKFSYVAMDSFVDCGSDGVKKALQKSKQTFGHTIFTTKALERGCIDIHKILLKDK